MFFLLNRNAKKWVATLTLCSLLFLLLPMMAFAEKVEGKTVVTLGENLSKDQQAKLLEEMKVVKAVEAGEVEVIYVSNSEEHQYLGQYISAEQIGKKALSSAKITLTSKGSGLKVQTKNISWVTEAMFSNALVTAGIKDADVYVTAPFKVSGTAGLTGLLKAFEVAAGEQISEEQKQVANEEMVRTAELGERIGPDVAAELVTRLKEALADTPLETEEDYRNLVLRVAEELNVQLTEEDITALIHLLERLKGLNINWDEVGNQLRDIRNNLDEFLNQEETKSFIREFLDFLIVLIEKVKELFGAQEKTA
jgi:uncharacterized protein YpuA (DUF1002 family)